MTTLDEPIELLLAERKRARGLEKLESAALGAEYRANLAWTRRLDECYWEMTYRLAEGGACNKKLRLAVRRCTKANWAYQGRIETILVNRGVPGIAVLVELFLGGDLDLRYVFCELAATHFPEVAEPGLIEIIERPETEPWKRHHVRKVLKGIRVANAIGRSPFEPTIGGDIGTGLAPTLGSEMDPEVR